jgi:hypothetical protein
MLMFSGVLAVATVAQRRRQGGARRGLRAD